jgi:tRNA(fMet)-specific endonuclease VapC
MLDTNMVSYILRGKSPAARGRLASLAPTKVACVSAISEGELLYGLAKIGASEQRRRALDWFLTRLQVHPWGREAAAAYGVLRARQEANGKTLGPLDMEIAAHAIAMGAVLVSRDKAFGQVTGLPGLEDWATDI